MESTERRAGLEELGLSPQTTEPVRAHIRTPWMTVAVVEKERIVRQPQADGQVALGLERLNRARAIAQLINRRALFDVPEVGI